MLFTSNPLEEIFFYANSIHHLQTFEDSWLVSTPVIFWALIVDRTTRFIIRSVLVQKLHMELPPGVKFRPNDQEIVLYHLLNTVQGNPIFKDSMNVIVDCDVFGDPSTWMKIFQETYMDRVYFYTKLKKKNKHIERSTHSATWRSQNSEGRRALWW